MQESPWTTEKFSIETPSPIILINPIFLSGKTFHTNVFHKEINMEICFFFPSSFSKQIPLEISFFSIQLLSKGWEIIVTPAIL